MGTPCQPHAKLHGKNSVQYLPNFHFFNKTHHSSWVSYLFSRITILKSIVAGTSIWNYRNCKNQSREWVSSAWAQSHRISNLIRHFTKSSSRGSSLRANSSHLLLLFKPSLAVRSPDRWFQISLSLAIIVTTVNQNHFYIWKLHFLKSPNKCKRHHYITMQNHNRNNWPICVNAQHNSSRTYSHVIMFYFIQVIIRWESDILW